jgi:hypothetical protein
MKTVLYKVYMSVVEMKLVHGKASEYSGYVVMCKVHANSWP